jgi:hypothetical protein
MLLVLLLLLALGTGQADVVLSDSMEGGLQLMNIQIYKRQYPCFHQNLSGVRRLLTFELVLNNTGYEEHRVAGPTYPLNYAVMRGNVQEIAGTIDVPSLRDTACYDNGTMKFYNGHLKYPTAGLSPHCTFVLRAGQSCMWIDITALPVQSYDVVMSLSPLLNPLVPPAGSVVLPVNLLTAPRLTFGGSSDAIWLSIVSSASILFLGLYPCVRYEIRKPKKRNERLKSQ